MFYLYIWFILVILIYSVLAYILIKGWQKIKEIKKTCISPFFISLIVAARNEEQEALKIYLMHLFNNLIQKIYLNVIIIDGFFK